MHEQIESKQDLLDLEKSSSCSIILGRSCALSTYSKVFTDCRVLYKASTFTLSWQWFLLLFLSSVFVCAIAFVIFCMYSNMFCYICYVYDIGFILNTLIKSSQDVSKNYNVICVEELSYKVYDTERD